MQSLRLVIPAALLALGEWAQGDVQCRDENNNPVDWYVFYKFPKLTGSSEPMLKKGNGYMFITSESVDKGWQISSNGIDEESSLLAKTLPFLKDPQKEALWFVYNDQGNEIYSESDTTFGHTKGVVAGDKSSGLWLVHSIPHFINGTYPRTGFLYAQSALCVTLSADTLNSVGDLLALNNPNCVNRKIVDALKSQYPKIIVAFSKKHKSKIIKNKTKEITTLEGSKLKAFAKTGDYVYDLYEWVASNLKTDLFVESWIHYSHTIPSSCREEYRVINVRSLVIPTLNVNFSSYKDHSKVAISNSDEHWVCVGDINRAEPQKKRGGGTVCLENKMLQEAYLAMIYSAENCNSV